MSEQSRKVDWGPQIHAQFKRQAGWTEDFRRQIYRQVNLSTAKKILDVGCGTGVLEKELRKKSSAKIFGIDIDENMIAFAKTQVKNVEFLVENAENINLKGNQFDVVFCQYLLMWVSSPEKVVSEMVRVCKNDGYVVALAEPDYGGWIEYPELNLGKNHIKYLRQQGADPEMGRKLLSLFEKAGLQTYLITIAQSWNQENLQNNIEEEWKRILEAGLITEANYSEIIKKELELIENNQRMIFMPVFCAIGRNDF